MRANAWGHDELKRIFRLCRIYASVDRVSIGQDNGLSPGWHQTIILTNAGISLMRPLVINFSEILIKINVFWFEKMHLKMSFPKWCIFIFHWCCLDSFLLLRHRALESYLLKVWGRNKMVNILQTTFSNVFSWDEIVIFRLKFHQSLSNWPHGSTGSGNCVVPNWW